MDARDSGEPGPDAAEARMGAAPAASGKADPTSDPMYYNTWRLILSRPFTKPKSRALLRELLSGLTVSLAQVPEAVAFSFTAGVDPIIGLQAAWMVGLFTALFGGAPGMVSGATGALAVVLPDFVAEHGVGYLFITVMFMGIIQFVFGLLGGGRLIKLVGHPVMLGFCNGLAIVIGIAQFHSFKYSRYCPVACDSPSYDWNECVAIEDRDLAMDDFKCDQWITGAVAGFQALEVVATMLIIWLLPRLTKAIPSSLAGIVLGTVIEFAIVRPAGYETPTVGDLGSIKGSFPIPVWLDDQYKDLLPSLSDPETYRICLPVSATMAVIGLVESLMTLQLVGQITNKKPSPRAEALAQGAANIITGILGGMGGCAMIGQSMINVKSGGVTRISTAFAGAFLLVIILVAYPAINLVPVASLAGVMFMVVIGTFEWHSLSIVLASLLPEKLRKSRRFQWMRKVKRSDVFIIVLVTVVAVATNLAYAVGAGVVFAALIFAWDQEQLLEARPVDPAYEAGVAQRAPATFGESGPTNSFGEAPSDLDNDLESGLPSHVTLENTKIYQIRGPLFFASAQKFVGLFDYFEDPQIVMLYLDQTVLSDYSAMVAVNSVAAKYTALGKELHLRKVTSVSMRLLRKAHHLVYTYDKQRADDVNEADLLCMAEEPNWLAHGPVLVNPYPQQQSHESQAGKPTSQGRQQSGVTAGESDQSTDGTASEPRKERAKGSGTELTAI